MLQGACISTSKRRYSGDTCRELISPHVRGTVCPRRRPQCFGPGGPVAATTQCAAAECCALREWA